jgi:hypothetical protein
LRITIFRDLSRRVVAGVKGVGAGVKGVRAGVTLLITGIL